MRGHDHASAWWAAATAATTWISLERQGRGSDRETRFYTMMTWASGDTDIHRTSASGQASADGDVHIDTFKRAAAAAPLDAYRLRVTLYRRIPSTATPSIQMLAAMVSSPFEYELPSPFDASAIYLPVPALPT